jgi:hypothetical protein
MPRPKKTPVYEEGPQAAENFLRTMQRLVRTPRRALDSESRETTTVTVEKATRATRRRKARQR